MIEVITDGHYKTIESLFDNAKSRIRIISPFLTPRMADLWCDRAGGLDSAFITRFYMQDFLDGSNSIGALRKMVESGINVYALLKLHTQLYLFDDADADKLIAVGAAILIAGIAADNVNLWLKQVGSRPRYKYLITLDDPDGSFRNWWQMVPYLAGSDDNFKSWPSGNMTIASMMFSLPMLADVCKKKSMAKNLVCFGLACAFVALYGYNRIHMTNHFLTDVCFGTLITYIIYSVISTAFLKAAEKKK